MAGPPSRSLLDYAYDFFKSIVDGAGPTLFGTINTNVTNGLPAVQQTTDLSAFGGDVAAPAAGAVIATIANVPAGTWDFYLYTNLSGTTAGLDRPNLAFNIAAVQKLVILSTLGGITDLTIFRATLATPTTVTVTAIATSTAGSVYRTSIVARRVA